jgi:hypothetical protein
MNIELLLEKYLIEKKTKTYTCTECGQPCDIDYPSGELGEKPVSRCCGENVVKTKKANVNHTASDMSVYKNKKK